MEEAIKLGATHIELKSDSELVVRQINGIYRVKKLELKPLYQKVKHLQGLLQDFTVTYIPRWQNAEADRLASLALGLPVD
jgi:ribonuclease HI